MIFIGLGSNLPGPWGSPSAMLRRALDEIDLSGIKVHTVSALFTSRSYGRHGAPNYVNAVARVETFLPPQALLLRLHAIEKRGARARGQRWGPRTLDLDLLDWNGRITGPRSESGKSAAGFRPLSLPHPGIVRRPFVTIPLAEIMADWHHPVSGETAITLARRAEFQKEGRILAIEALR